MAFRLLGFEGRQAKLSVGTGRASAAIGINADSIGMRAR
jgi:hypothetical protein